MDFNYGDITDKMTNCCVEISDPTPIHVASRFAEDRDPIGAGSFVESDRIEKSWADEKLVIPITFSQWSDRFWNRAQKYNSIYHPDGRIVFLIYDSLRGNLFSSCGPNFFNLRFQMQFMINSIAFIMKVS